MGSSGIITVAIATTCVLVLIIIVIVVVVTKRRQNLQTLNESINTNVNKSSALTLQIAQLQLQLTQLQSSSGYIEGDPVSSDMQAMLDQLAKLNASRASVNNQLYNDTVSASNIVQSQINDAGSQIATIQSSSSVSVADQQLVDTLKAQIAELEKQSAALAEQRKTVAPNIGVVEVCGGKRCGPKGTLNSALCTCSCIDGYTGLLCSVPPALPPPTGGSTGVIVPPVVTACTVGFKGPPTCTTRDYTRVHALTLAQKEFLCKGSWGPSDSMNMGTGADSFWLTPASMPGDIEHLFADGWFTFNRDKPNLSGCAPAYGTANIIDTSGLIVPLQIKSVESVKNVLRLPPHSLYEVWLRGTTTGKFIVPGWPVTANKSYAIELANGQTISYVGYSPPINSDVASVTHRYYDLINSAAGGNLDQKEISRCIIDIQNITNVMSMLTGTVAADIVKQLTAWKNVLQKISTVQQGTSASGQSNIAAVLSQVPRSEGFGVTPWGSDGTAWQNIPGLTQFDIGTDNAMTEYVNVPIAGDVMAPVADIQRELDAAKLNVVVTEAPCPTGYMSSGSGCVPDYTVMHALTPSARTALCKPIKNAPPVIVGQAPATIDGVTSDYDWYFTPYAIEYNPSYDANDKKVKKLFPDGWFTFGSDVIQPYCKNLNAYGVCTFYSNDGAATDTYTITDNVRPQYESWDKQTPSLKTFIESVETGVTQVSKFFVIEVYGVDNYPSNVNNSMFVINCRWKKYTGMKLDLADGTTFTYDGAPPVNRDTADIIIASMVASNTLYGIRTSDASNVVARINNIISSISAKTAWKYTNPASDNEIIERLKSIRDTITDMALDDHPPVPDIVTTDDPAIDITPTLPVPTLPQTLDVIGQLYRFDEYLNGVLVSALMQNMVWRYVHSDGLFIKFTSGTSPLYSICGDGSMWRFYQQSFPGATSGFMVTMAPLLTESAFNALISAVKINRFVTDPVTTTMVQSELDTNIMMYQQRVNDASNIGDTANTAIAQDILSMLSSQRALIDIDTSTYAVATMFSVAPDYSTTVAEVRTRGNLSDILKTPPAPYSYLKLADGRYIFAGWGDTLMWNLNIDGKYILYSNYSPPVPESEAEITLEMYKFDYGASINTGYISEKIVGVITELMVSYPDDQYTEEYKQIKMRCDTYTEWLAKIAVSQRTGVWQKIMSI